MLTRMSDASGVDVVQVSRKSRYLLLEIEAVKEKRAHWLYRELAPRKCVFSCRAGLGETLKVALQGKLLAQLAVPHDAIAVTTIDQVQQTGDGWLSVDVTPRWEEF